MHMQLGTIAGIPLWLLVVITLWSIVWKGIALWKAAERGHKKWFIVILIANTLGILDIFYIRFVASKYSVEKEEK